jgi:hypothetical protein
MEERWSIYTSSGAYKIQFTMTFVGLRSALFGKQKLKQNAHSSHGPFYNKEC